MEKRQLVKGMIVRIKKDLSKTYSAFGRSSNGEMERMKGKHFPIFDFGGIRKSSQTAIKIKDSVIKFPFIFHVDDIEVCDVDLYDDNIKIEYPKPVTFNPTHLDI